MPEILALHFQHTRLLALDKFAAVQMIDARFPTADGRELVLTRYTEPELRLLLDKLMLALRARPPKPPPRQRPCNADLRGPAPAISIR